MRRSVYHHTNKRTQIQRYTTSTWERSLKKIVETYAANTRLCYIKDAAAASPSDNQSSTINLSRTHTKRWALRSGVATSEYSCRSTIEKPLIPNHSAWGSCLSLLYQVLRYLKLQIEHHLRPTVTKNTTTPCTPIQVHQNPWPLCSLPPTHWPCTPQLLLRTSNPDHLQYCHEPRGVSKSDTPKRDAMPMAPPSSSNKLK
jgi:hypothetical protein